MEMFGPCVCGLGYWDLHGFLTTIAFLLVYFPVIRITVWDGVLPCINIQ